MVGAVSRRMKNKRQDDVSTLTPRNCCTIPQGPKTCACSTPSAQKIIDKKQGF